MTLTRTWSQTEPGLPRGPVTWLPLCVQVRTGRTDEARGLLWLMEEEALQPAGCEETLLGRLFSYYGPAEGESKGKARACILKRHVAHVFVLARKDLDYMKELHKITDFTRRLRPLAEKPPQQVLAFCWNRCSALLLEGEQKQAGPRRQNVHRAGEVVPNLVKRMVPFVMSQMVLLENCTS